MTGEQLKNALLSQKINLSSVARKIGLSPQALNERFKNDDPKYSFVEKIVQASGISFPDLALISSSGLKEGDEEYVSIATYKDKYLSCVEENAELMRKLIALQEELLNIRKAASE